MLASWFFGWPVVPLGISALAGPWAGRSATGSGDSFRCGSPPASSVASTLGPSRCGWAGSAGGVAASSASCVVTRVWPSGAGASSTWPPSAGVPPLPSAVAGLGAGVPPSGCGIPVGSSWPGAFARGASAGTVACVGSRSASGSGPGDCQMVFPWAVLLVQLVGRGAVEVPARPVPGPADDTLGPTCLASLELSDWGSRWGCGRGGVWC